MLVRKTLRKNCEERYQTVRELLADLRDLRQELTDEVSFARTSELEPAEDSGDMQALACDDGPRSRFCNKHYQQGDTYRDPASSHYCGSRHRARVLALTYAGGRVYRSGRPAETFQTMRLAKLTSIGSVEGGQAAVSPDGKYIAYVMNDAGRQSLWVKQTSTSSNVQIAAGET